MKSLISSVGSVTSLLVGSTLSVGSQPKIAVGSASLGAWRVKAGGLC